MAEGVVFYTWKSNVGNETVRVTLFNLFYCYYLFKLLKKPLSMLKD